MPLPTTGGVLSRCAAELIDLQRPTGRTSNCRCFSIDLNAGLLPHCDRSGLWPTVVHKGVTRCSSSTGCRQPLWSRRCGSAGAGVMCHSCVVSIAELQSDAVRCTGKGFGITFPAAVSLAW